MSKVRWKSIIVVVNNPSPANNRRSPRPPRSRAAAEHARDVIAAVAQRQGADLLVMGAVSRSMLKRPVIGSTAESVIDHVDCDVLVVKPAGFKTPVKRAQVKV